MKTATKEKKTVPAVKKASDVKKAAAPAKKAAVPAKPAKKAAAPATKNIEKPAAKAPVKKSAAPAKAAKKAVAPVVEEPAAEKKASVHKKLKLSKTQKKHYIDILLKLRNEFMDQLQFHRDDALSSKKDAAGERAGMATHMADLGSDNFRHDVELGLLSDEGDVVIMIDEALQRIEDSEFGICTECGCEIPAARLEAKPYARFCTKCKSRHEQQDDPLKHHR